MQLKFIVFLFLFNGIATLNLIAQNQSIDQLEDILKEAKKSKNLKGEVQGNLNIGDYYYNKNDLRKAERYYKRSLKVNDENQFAEEAAKVYRSFGLIELQNNKFEKAEKAFKTALKIAKKEKLNSLQEQLTKDINQLNTTQNKHIQAQEQYKQLKSLSKDEALNLISQENTQSEEENENFLNEINQLSKENQLTQLKLRFKQNELSKKELKIALLDQYNAMKDLEVLQKEQDLKSKNAIIAQKNAESEKQKIIIYYSIAALLLLLVLVFYIYRNNIQRKKHNLELKRKNEIITEKNNEITASIEYAKKIQDAILLSSHKQSKALSENFIFYQPKDIVSGDFYWIAEIDNLVIWSVADCTGHGVPGALMSMIGNRLLNEIILEKRIFKPNLILDELKTKIIHSLNQEGDVSDSKDGMDIAICIYDKKTQILEYAGANNSIYILNKDIVNECRIESDKYRAFESDLIEILPNRIPVGYNAYINTPFDSHQIKIKKGDVIYLFSDGFYDQFGGEKTKKYTSKRFKKLIYDMYEKPMEHQKNRLNTTLMDWKKDLEQLDDICIIGVRI